MTHTLADQFAWEDEMIYRGVQRYRAQQKAAIDSDRATDTSAGSRLLGQYVLQVSDYMDDYLQGRLPGRRRVKFAKLLDTIDTDILAMFTLRHIIGAAFSDRHKRSVQAMGAAIGLMVEDELRFSKFQTEHKTYYDEIIRKFEEGFTADYRHKHRVLAHLSKTKGMEWREWSREERFRAGALAMQLAVEVCDLVEVVSVPTNKGKPSSAVQATQACVDWVIKHDLVTELASPDRMPSLIKPADWLDAFDGGYWGPRLRLMTPLIKGTAHRRGRVETFQDACMPRVLTAVNALQRTSWRVNKEVHAVMSKAWEHNLPIGMPQSQPYEIPPCPLAEGASHKDLIEGSDAARDFRDWKATARQLHNLETDRTAKLRAIIRTTRIAGEMREEDRFYYVHQCDFRGRSYSSTTGLSPQGTDHSKGLLTFGQTKPLGLRGLYWLKVHGANKFGYDKVSFDDRVAWVDSQCSLWRAIAHDPIGMRNGWQSCDKPWQFLAWCFEYKRATDAGPDYRSSLPIALDGSCNGLQHFSAMLRDPIGGAAVNLVPSDKPADIYQDVADVCTQRLRGLSLLPGADGEGAAHWVKLFESLSLEGMPRELSKKPVMTLPYGSTPSACTASIFAWIQEKAPKFFDERTNFRHALHLSPILWDSISDVVVAAREAMSWIQRASSVVTKKKQALRYESPLGFPIVQDNRQIKLKNIRTQIGGDLRVFLAQEKPELDGRKQRNGSSPNLIHSVDATHMMMVVNAGLEQGIDHFAMIHDDFGTHACDIDKFQQIIRRTFVTLHTDHDPLADFKERHETDHEITLPPLPERGTLDLQDVVSSPYFFG